VKRCDIEVGRVYRIQMSGKPTPVRVEDVKSVRPHSHRSLYGGTTRFHFLCRSLRTDRMIEVKSAQRFQCELTWVSPQPPELYNPDRALHGKWMPLPTFQEAS
jgi:hypothetical protein